MSRSIALCGVLLLCPLSVSAFDSPHGKVTYFEPRNYKLFFGSGLSGVASENGVDSDGMDMSLRLGVGFALTQRVQWDFFYQLSSIPLRSPNPLGGTLASKMFMNHLVSRLLYRYDRFALIPYLHGGLGLYQMTAVNPQSGLDFPIGLQMPLGAGLETYFYQDRWSVAVEYDYHLLFDEEQNQGVLSLLGLPDIELDVQSIILQVTWHFF